MPQIHPFPLPINALLTKYTGAGAYADCFATDIARSVSHAEFVEAFYTGRLFKLERLLLRAFLSKPSTDLQAQQLAASELNEFAVWKVEARAENQLLLCAIDGRTRSWLMVSTTDVPGGTRLYFGSALLPGRKTGNASTGKPTMGFTFKALLSFHNFYSRALLSAAARRLSCMGESSGKFTAEIFSFFR